MGANDIHSDSHITLRIPRLLIVTNEIVIQVEALGN